MAAGGGGAASDSNVEEFHVEHTASLDDGDTSSSSSSVAPVTIPETTDVVIIGAGPTGLTLACELARRGVNFLIFDVNPRPASQSRAILLHARTLEIFADLGIAPAAVLSGHIIRGLESRVNNTPVFDMKFAGIDSPFPFTLVLDQTETERLLSERLGELGHKVFRPFAVWRVEIAPTRSAEDASFFAFHARSQGSSAAFLQSTGVFGGLQTFASTLDEFQSGTSTPMDGGGGKQQQQRSGGPAVSIGISGESDQFPQTTTTTQNFSCVVHVKALDPEGRPIVGAGTGGGAATSATLSPTGTPAAPFGGGQVRCRYVIGADGARSCVRKAAGIEFAPQSELEEFLVADVAVQWGISLSQDRMTVLQNPSGGLMCIPMTQGRWRIMCSRKAARDGSGDDVNEAFTRLEPPDFVELQQILETLVPGTVLNEVFWNSSFASSARVAATFKKSSVLLLGDSAHVLSPTFSQGLNAGVQDAYNVGWKLAAVIRGAPSVLLETYDLERRQVIGDELSRLSSTVLDALLKNGNGFQKRRSHDLRCRHALCHHNALFPSGWTGYPHPMIAPNFLCRGALIPGSYLRDAAVVIVPPISENVMAPTVESPTGLAQCIRGGQHVLLLAVHVLPPGTKTRTLFGCERNEEAIRWNMKCLERLAKLGRILGETLKGRETEITWGGLKIIWILCGLVNFKTPSNTVGMGHIKDHVPHRLRHFFQMGARLPVRSTLVVDYEGEVHYKYGFRLADPDGLQGASKSGAFVLIRPDGHLCCNGYAGDAQAASTAFDYVLTWFSG